MLNILEDYLIASGISYGRIDGSIQGRNRQKVQTCTNRFIVYEKGVASGIHRAECFFVFGQIDSGMLGAIEPKSGCARRFPTAIANL